ncbi:MAG: transglycosylase domain-containing protein, partial [Acidimicrobiales bacterium]
MRGTLRVLAIVVMSAIGVPLAVMGTALATFLYLPLPAAVPTAHYSPAPQISYIYAANGLQIGQFSGASETIPVPDSAIPAILKNAVVASEDRNFYHEGGISVRGTLRALLADVTNHGVVQGGSTITQQYVKEAYTSGSRTLYRKVKEAILASELSRSVSKEQILYDYLSTTYFGEGAYGVGAAANVYFRTPVAKLDASQAALLAGLIPAPSVYDPLVNPDIAEVRRRHVLGLMLAQHYIDESTYNRAIAEHVVVAGHPGADANATVVFPPQAAQPTYPYFVDYVRRFLATKLTDQQLTSGGLRIQTTLDPTLQNEALASVNKSLSGTRSPLDMALVSVEPATGYVKALVGGRDFATSQVNLALGGCPTQPTSPKIEVQVAATCWSGGSVSGGGGGRQPGSSFKPFVLAA